MFFSATPPTRNFLPADLFKQPVREDHIVLFGERAELFYESETFRVYRLQTTSRVLVYRCGNKGWGLLAWFPSEVRDTLDRESVQDFPAGLQLFVDSPDRFAA